MVIFIQCNFLLSLVGLHLEVIQLLMLLPGKTYCAYVKNISEAYAEEVGRRQCVY